MIQYRKHLNELLIQLNAVTEKCVGGVVGVVTEFLRDPANPGDPSPQFISRLHDHRLIVWSGAALACWFTARDGRPTDSTTTTKKCGQKEAQIHRTQYEQFEEMQVRKRGADMEK